MANAWFRLYSEFANDPKVQMMSEADQRRLVMLFCIRCSNGHVTLHDTEVAFQLRVTPEEWAITKALFISKGFINEDNMILNWDKRQFISDSSAARVRAYRERKKQQVIGCNVTVTPPDTDTDTDTDKHKNIKPMSGKPDPDVLKVFTHWKEVMNHRRALFDEKRAKLIARWLKPGAYSVEDLMQAIDGCARTPHNMGQNETRTRYDDLGLILRDAEHIDRFRRNAESAPTARRAAI